MSDGRMLFYHAIANGLSAHPEWLRDAMDAISSGMAGALANANDRAAKKDAAFLSALSLADPARLSSKNKEILNQAIVAAINPANASETERKALERAKDNANG
jgi:hypothetical protein